MAKLYESDKDMTMIWNEFTGRDPTERELRVFQEVLRKYNKWSVSFTFDEVWPETMERLGLTPDDFRRCT